MDTDRATAPADGEGRTDADAEEGESAADPVELGVELLSKLERTQLSIAETVDRIETITTEPAITREILETAERRGVIERENAVVRPQYGSYMRFESEVIAKTGEFTCRRCGTGLSTGHFVRFEAGDHGPFGSSCIRKVTGRERE